MGQTNDCCHMTFMDPQFDINEVKMYWPALAQEIKVLRQLNRQQKVIRNENIQAVSRDSKAQYKVYREFITRQYCFFGFVTYSYNAQTSQLTYRQQNSHNPFKSQLQIDSQNSSRKQNNIPLNFLPKCLQLNNYGILIHRQKAYYKGIFRNGQYHGKGVLCLLQNDEIFQGIFQNGVRVKGVYRNSLIKYVGQFKDDQLSGKGELTWNNTGDVYEGEIKHGKMDGVGKIVYKDGQSYEGEFQNGLYHGRGIYRWASGQIFKGMYKKGLKHGFGVITIEGAEYQLCWVDGNAQAKPQKYEDYKSRKDLDKPTLIIQSNTKNHIQRY